MYTWHFHLNTFWFWQVKFYRSSKKGPASLIRPRLCEQLDGSLTESRRERWNLF